MNNPDLRRTEGFRTIDHVLRLLRNHKGKVVPREVFCKSIWNDDVNECSLNSLCNAVSQLRKRGYQIKNVKMVGYRLVEGK